MMLVPLGGGPLVDLDATLFIQLVLFLVMFLFLYLLLFRPAIRLIEARREATEGARARAREMLEESRRLTDEIEAGLLENREAAEAERNRVLEQARRRERERIDRTREEIRLLIDDSHARLEREAAAARTEIEAGIPAMAAAMAGQLLGREVRR